MHFLSLIFTVHEEQGLANAHELEAVLLRAMPDAIFLEVPAAAFDGLYVSRVRNNLESIAVNRYVQRFAQTKLIPIDSPTPAREFFEDHEYLCMRVSEASPRYRQLMSLDRDRLRAHGFSYLNSKYCSQHWADLSAEMLDTAKQIGEPRLNEVLQTWDRTNELRELEMVNNIRKYCSTNTFETGVALMGAAHRSRIIEQAAQQSEFSWGLLSSGEA